MSNEGYYKRFLKYKRELDVAIENDRKYQKLALGEVGIKPQRTAVEITARSYCAYCALFNKLCDVYDQTQQVQKRDYIKEVIDALTCRIIELKKALEEIEHLEYTYYDNGLKQMFMIPDNVQILAPHFYSSEIRDAELQYVVTEILSGNRLGDPTPTPSEIERREEERIEQERIRLEEKEAENLRLIAMGEEVPEEDTDIKYTPEQLEQKRRQDEYNKYVANIQRQERTRKVTYENIQKLIKDQNLYLELAGLKKHVPERLQEKAIIFIQKVYRQFMNLKRLHVREYKLRLKIDMIIPAYAPPSQKLRLKEIKEARREFRRKYFKEWIDRNVKEKDKILKWKKGEILEDIGEEIRQWFRIWFKKEDTFDEFPWPEEGGSILIARGETFTFEEYEEWAKKELKRRATEKQNPKTKEDIKAEKLAAKEEKKRLATEAKERERKKLKDYKKQRLQPETDPGILLPVGNFVDPVIETWHAYETEWRAIETPDPIIDAIKGFIMKLIIEHKYKEINYELRPIVDEIMRMELALLRKANAVDFKRAKENLPITMKRKRPKKEKLQKPEKTPPKVWFQKAVDNGLVVNYPRVTFDDFWGDRNYAAADQRAILWTPVFSPPCLGDIEEQVRLRCVLALGANCSKIQKTQLLVGPKGFGKKTLAYAVATETNSILIDLSPSYVQDKMKGKNKALYRLVNKVSRLMQPTVILVNEADKMFYKKVPKEEKDLNPTRLAKDFYKELVKGITAKDKIMIIGTATQPWLAKATIKKVFPQVILFPNTDYGSISYILTKELMPFHGVHRDFNVQSVAQTLRGYDIATIRKAIKNVMTPKRLTELKFRPLEPIELVNAVITDEAAVYTDDFDYSFYTNWYKSYCARATDFEEYKFMLNSQYEFKLKKEKGKKKKPA